MLPTEGSIPALASCSLYLIETYWVDSSGHRNTVFVGLWNPLVKRLCGRLPAERLSGSGVEGGGHCGDLLVAVHAQIGTRDQTPSEQLARGPQVKTCGSFAASWLPLSQKLEPPKIPVRFSEHEFVDVSVAACLDPQNAETAFLIVERDALDEDRHYFPIGWYGLGCMLFCTINERKPE